LERAWHRALKELQRLQAQPKVGQALPPANPSPLPQKPAPPPTNPNNRNPLAEKWVRSVKIRKPRLPPRIPCRLPSPPQTRTPRKPARQA
jgi:hypothetical protein